MKRRVFSIITALALCLSLCPTWAFAAGPEPDTGLCAHHPEHIGCGYVQADPGQPCAYECKLCPIEELLDALPRRVTEDNWADVEAQLQEILALYTLLTPDEQDLLDLSRVYDLQAELDAVNAPMTADAQKIDIAANAQTTLTEDGECPGHIFSGSNTSTTIFVESGTHNVTFSGLTITSGHVGIASGGTMNLTITGTNSIQGETDYAGIYVPTGAALVITEQSTGSLNVTGGGGAVGIGGATLSPGNSATDRNGGTVVINGGTITAAGGNFSAGIGGAYKGNGGNLTINGGSVTLTSVDTYGFGRGYGAVSGTPCELTLADKSCLDAGTTLDPSGAYFITTPTEDMIVVPENLVYKEGYPLDVSGIQLESGTVTYCGQTFTIPIGDGWERSFSPAEITGVGRYTVTFAKGGKSISKTFLLHGDVRYLDENGQEQIAAATLIDGSKYNEMTLADGKWYVADGTATRRLDVTGTANLILADGCTLNSTGQSVASGGSLTVYGQSKGSGSWTSNYSLGINGQLTINGGTIKTPFQVKKGGTMTLNRGTVRATGTAGAGLSNEGTFTINGGTFSASSLTGAAISGDGKFYTSVLAAEDIFLPDDLTDTGEDQSETVKAQVYTNITYSKKSFELTGWNGPEVRMREGGTNQYEVTYTKADGSGQTVTAVLTLPKVALTHYLDENGEDQRAESTRLPTPMVILSLAP